MTAWQRLLATSSLAIGTAWQLISSPKTGTGTGATIVYVREIKSKVVDGAITSKVTGDTITSAVAQDKITSVITVFDAVTNLPDTLISMDIKP